MTEQDTRENMLSLLLVDLIIEKVYVYPDERLEIVWKSSSFGDLDNSGGISCATV